MKSYKNAQTRDELWQTNPPVTNSENLADKAEERRTAEMQSHAAIEEKSSEEVEHIARSYPKSCLSPHVQTPSFRPSGAIQSLAAKIDAESRYKREITFGLGPEIDDHDKPEMVVHTSLAALRFENPQLQTLFGWYKGPAQG